MEHQRALQLYVCTHVCPQIGQLAEVLDCDGLLIFASRRCTGRSQRPGANNKAPALFKPSCFEVEAALPPHAGQQGVRTAHRPQPLPLE